MFNCNICEAVGGMEDRRCAPGPGRDPISHSQFSLQISRAVTAGSGQSDIQAANCSRNKQTYLRMFRSCYYCWYKTLAEYDLYSFYFLAFCHPRLSRQMCDDCRRPSPLPITVGVLVMFEVSKLHFTFPQLLGSSQRTSAVAVLCSGTWNRILIAH